MRYALTLLISLGLCATAAAGDTIADGSDAPGVAVATGKVDQVASGLDGGLSAGALFDELARMDSTLFDASFVTCDAAKANAIFAEDVEFYHDKDGLSVGEQVRESTRRLTASCPREQGVTRTVVRESLRVFPIAGYGAAQVGIHRFDERGAATSMLARFVHVWRMQDGTWRLARILSLDHETVPAAGAVNN